MDAANLLWGVLFSAIGAGYLMYARKQRAPVPLVCGLSLMIYPYFVSNTWVLVIVGIALTVAPYFIRL